MKLTAQQKADCNKAVLIAKTDLNTLPPLFGRCCYVPFLFGQKHKTLLVTILLALMLFYVNLGLPYRVRHREERYCYIYWFA